jgi:hypothetical protein
LVVFGELLACVAFVERNSEKIAKSFYKKRGAF